jgi:hypothetical protein
MAGPPVIGGHDLALPQDRAGEGELILPATNPETGVSAIAENDAALAIRPATNVEDRIVRGTFRAGGSRRGRPRLAKTVSDRQLVPALSAEYGGRALLVSFGYISDLEDKPVGTGQRVTACGRPAPWSARYRCARPGRGATRFEANPSLTGRSETELDRLTARRDERACLFRRDNRSGLHRGDQEQRHYHGSIPCLASMR